MTVAEMNRKADMVEIFTDGACLSNPGPGGWGVLMRWRGEERELAGRESNTTNNRMELMAAIQGLEALKHPCRVVLTTDSTYVRDGITKWIKGWKQNGWKTAAKKPVKNIDLWKRLDISLAEHEIDWRWVRGHAGHFENERVDQLASSQAKREAEISSNRGVVAIKTEN